MRGQDSCAMLAFDMVFSSVHFSISGTYNWFMMWTLGGTRLIPFFQLQTEIALFSPY
ncbi:MAG: hypothetical protein ACFFB5_23135 [Promethearchaeota archaeon]